MDSVYKNRFVFWLLVVLIVINLSALLTFIFYVPYRFESNSQQSSAPKAIPGFQQELSLTPEQSTAVKKINTDYQKVSQPIVDQIRDNRQKLLDVLSSDETDTAELNAITLELSKLQINLQKDNIQQYLALKKICSPEQSRKLSILYGKLYGCEQPGFGKGKGRGMGQGKGMQYRHRHGQNRE